MNATASVGLFTWFWIAVLGGANGFPAAGPPLPLDPQLSVIAPERCLLYVSHAGYAPADPNSDHPTEQLYAEPQVQRFAEEVATQLRQLARRGVGAEKRGRVLAEEGPKLIEALMTRPLAFYVEDVQLRSGRLDVEAALVVDAGDQLDALRTAISRLLGIVSKNGPKVTSDKVAGLDWKRIELRPDAPVIRIGYYEQYVILAIGDQTPDRLAERSEGSPPDWLEKLREEHRVDREISVSYLDIPGIVERLRQVQPDAPGWAVAGQLGLNGLQELHTISGFDAQGCVSYSHLVTGAGRNGLLSLLPYKPLSKRDLEAIPADALMAVACRWDLDEAFEAAVRLAGDLDPKLKEKIEDALWKVETEVGVDLHDDLLHALGDVWIGYVPAGDLVSSWLGSAVAVRVKDRGQLDEAVKKLVEAARREAPRGRRGGVDIRESTADGRTIYWLEFSGQPVPVAPAWCVSDEWLVVGLLPQTIHDVLDREEASSLADSESIEAAWSDAEGPTVVAYQDTPRLVRSVYPWLQMGVQAISSPLKRQGIEIDVAALPSASVIVKHLRPAVSTLAYRNDGYHAAAHVSVPSGGSVVTVAPVMAGLLMPAISKARDGARSVQELNHLKQIALGILNYESANGHFPTNVYDDQGRPLLSWRVQILPYMEENRLYDSIRMDEPWDSPHNRQFGAETPISYQSVAQPTPPGETRMLALAGKETVWPGNQEIRFREVRDGTSNTLMVVQASPQASVEWMKPDDIEFDPQDPFAGLLAPGGEFLGVFCDGSVHRLSDRIGKQVMRALATRDGGEVIDREALD